MNKIRVLMVASEVSPFAKTGGLADVTAVLPGVLNQHQCEVRVIMPLYRRIKQRYENQLKFIRWTMVKMGWRSMYSGLFSFRTGGVTYYFIDNEYYFGHDKIYLEYSFDIERFCFFQRAVLDALGEPMDFEPDIIHCHDWQTGLIPCLLEAHYFPYGYHRHIKTVYTIHNLKYQGIHGVERIADLCDMPARFLTEYGILKDGVPNLMKAGIVYSQAVTTVSPSYAEEILTPYYGEGLDGVLRSFSYKLTGIMNGIDRDLYNPQTDRNIPRNYDLTNWAEGKAAAKEALLKRVNLPYDKKLPLIGMVSRLVDQKGLDLLLRIIDELLSYGCQMVILGTGDEFYATQLQMVAQRHPELLAPCIYFDSQLANKIYAAADLFLMPSLFEPCGLSQMIAMRYGTLPIVRETGGLRDSVTPYNKYDGSGNGFSFANINAHELLYTTKAAIDLWRERSTNPAWNTLVENAMTVDFGWDNAAEEYLKLYKKVLGSQKEIPVE